MSGLRGLVNASVSCTICKTPGPPGTCSCWVKCICGWLYERGKHCRNEAHPLVAAKLANAAPARLLYKSAMFQAAFAWAQSFARLTFIVSALRELVHPDAVIEPYSFRLTELSVRERDAWGERIISRLVTNVAGIDPPQIVTVDGVSPCARASRSRERK
jgi:hypothetical protein